MLTSDLRHLTSRIFLAFVLLLAVAVAAEWGFFLKMTLSKPVLGKADLIAVFGGESGRVEQGYSLVNESYGSHLVITSASPSAVEYYRKKLNRSSSLDQILETKARTTFENAIYTKAIMAERGMRSVLLVTSWDHLPRAYSLLRILLLGHNMQIYRCGVATGRLDNRNWFLSSEGWKRMFNETISLWGSLYELVRYRIKGDITYDHPIHSPLVDFLRRALLFNVKSTHTAV